MNHGEARAERSGSAKPTAYSIDNQTETKRKKASLQPGEAESNEDTSAFN